MADEKDSAAEPFAHDDPSTKIWSSYISHAEKHDRRLARSWKGDMDSLLIFAGLFSASVTAFIIESYQTLSPDPTETTNTLLVQIFNQLAAISNTSAPIDASQLSFGVTPNTFVPPTSALICNTLWFLSLGFSLACALSATLVEQWVRNYLQSTESRATPHERARICAYLYHGLEKFNMAALVEAIPMLLHVSLLLFFAGLVEFLRPVNAAISYLTLGMLIICITLYALATILPIFWRDCPYQTPLSGVWWKVMKLLRVLRQQGPEGSTVIVSGSMASAREIEAIQISPERDQRDFDAMTWTLKNLRHESEFEAFVEVIPRVVAGHDYSAKLLLHRLLYHPNLFARLGYRIPRLLISCTGGVLDPALCQKRAATCLAAIWSLSMMAVHTDPWETPTPVQPPERRRFDELTLQDIQTVRIEVPGINDFAVSAATAIARVWLDLHIEYTIDQEMRLVEFIEGIGEKSYTYPLSETAVVHSRKRVIDGIHHNLAAFESYLASGYAIATPMAFTLISATYVKILKLLDHIVQPSPEVDVRDVTSQALKFLRRLRSQLNQAGYSLVADYASSFLAGSGVGEGRPLPYEVFKTFRRLFIKINPEQRVLVQTQVRLVACLDDVIGDGEGGTHVPQSIVNILLGLMRAVDDPTCALKAKTIITRSMRFFQSQDEARKTAEVLNMALPRPAPTLDLFTMHMYSNPKLDKGQTFSATPRRRDTA